MAQSLDTLIKKHNREFNSSFEAAAAQQRGAFLKAFPLGRLKRLAVAGLGAIGLAVAEALDRGIPGCVLAAVSANDRGKAAERLSHLGCRVPVVTIGELEPLADIVVECAPAKLLPGIAEPFLRAGKTVIVLSAGALLGHPHLVELARASGGQIVVPTGALLGLDAVTAAAEGEIRAVRMITRKPVRGLAGAPYLAEHNIEISDITEPLCVFRGTPREAAAAFRPTSTSRWRCRSRASARTRPRSRSGRTLR